MRLVCLHRLVLESLDRDFKFTLTNDVKVTDHIAFLIGVEELVVDKLVVV